jgi:hypothetical protein
VIRGGVAGIEGGKKGKGREGKGAWDLVGGGIGGGRGCKGCRIIQTKGVGTDVRWERWEVR